MDKILRKIYYDVKNPAGFASAEKLYKAAVNQIPELSRTQVKTWLSSQLTYTLHKPVRRRFVRNKTLVGEYNEQWQADLVDMQEFAKQNDGYKFILTVIDILSKYAYAVPLKTKSALNVKNAFEHIFETNKPQKLQTDKGTEFKNKILMPFLKENNVLFFTTKNDDIKCAVVERFNRTLKTKMFKYFTSKGTRKYINILPDLIVSYNHSKHSTTKMRPCEVNFENQDIVFHNIYGVNSVVEALADSQKPLIHSGDKVRIKYKFNPFDKGYYPNWTDHIYDVEKSIKGGKPLYKLKDWKGRSVDRRFYPEEIQKISDPLYRVEKVLKKKKQGGRTLCYVKWLNHPSSYNTWIPESDIEDIS